MKKLLIVLVALFSVLCPTQAKLQMRKVYVDVYGTRMSVRVPVRSQFALPEDPATHMKETVAVFDKVFKRTLDDCTTLKVVRKLSDWTYLRMLDKVATIALGETDEATLLMAYLLTRSNYRMLLGTNEGRLQLLYNAKETLYGKPFFTIGGYNYYPYSSNGDSDIKTFHICDTNLSGDNPLSFLICEEQKLDYVPTEPRVFQNEKNPAMKMNVSVNKNLIDFYADYPSFEHSGNAMTRWAALANTPLDKRVSKQIYPALRKQLKGLNQRQALTYLLELMQTTLSYEYDDAVWGHDRAFYAEETLYYPYADSEDYAILFSRLVRDLLHLKTCLIYYAQPSGHLSVGVCLNEEVKGGYVFQDGKRFTICEPCHYIPEPGTVISAYQDVTPSNIIMLE